MQSHLGGYFGSLWKTPTERTTTFCCPTSKFNKLFFIKNSFWHQITCGENWPINFAWGLFGGLPYTIALAACRSGNGIFLSYCLDLFKKPKKYEKWAFCPILGSKNNGSNRTEVTSAFGGGQPASHLAKHLGGRGVGLNSPWGIRPFDSNAGRGYELEVGNRSNFPHAISRNMRCKPCPKKMNSFGTFPKLTNFCLKGLGRKITLSGAFLN